MDNTMAVQAMTQPISRSMLGMDQGVNGMQGDGFAMIFAQLMGMGGEEEEDGLAAALLQMVSQLKQDEEEIGTQMAMEMLSSVPNFQPQMLLTLLQNGNAQAVSPAVQDVLQMLTQNQPSEREVQGTAMAFVQAAQTEEAEEIIDFDAVKTDDEFLQVLSNAWSQKKPETPVVHTDLDYGAVRAAREMLSKTKRETTETLDIEALQAQVNARRFMPADTMTQISEQPQVPDGEEIAAQVKTGILENVAQGKNEFVVKLKPEGIGEIMVKFSENKDKISLSIFTTSTQTARLISNEIASLQSALRPLQAEVQEIVVTPDGQAAQYSAQNQMTDQGRQFYDQQPSHQGENSHHSHRQETAFEDTVEATLETEGLDTYI